MSRTLTETYFGNPETPTIVTLRLTIPHEFRAKALNALEAISARWGLPIQLVTVPAEIVDLHYGTAQTGDTARVFIQFDQSLYQPETLCEERESDSVRIWCSSRLDTAQHDPIGAVYRLLNLLDESQVDSSARDRKGSFFVESLPRSRQSARLTALVENESEWLLARLNTYVERTINRPSRWPNGKRFAALLTHDVDAVRLGAPIEILYNGAKFLLRRDVERGKLAFAGVGSLFRSPAKDPLFGFSRWRQWEDSLGIKSLFYCFLQPGVVPRDMNDCRTSLDNTATDWGLLREMAAGGWEFGLHPSINAKTNSEAFRIGREYLERKLKHSVTAIRHHYLALNWLNPVETFKRQAVAGFKHDSSIGYRERAGFRAGTTLPYCPFDIEDDGTLDYLEIPMNIMDGQIAGCRYSGETAPSVEGEADGFQVINEVHRTGGVLVLNWHQEVIIDKYSYHGVFPALQKLLTNPLFADVWWTTPNELAAYWNDRRKRKLCGVFGDN